jgi:hypothetical protein
VDCAFKRENSLRENNALFSPPAALFRQKASTARDMDCFPSGVTSQPGTLAITIK